MILTPDPMGPDIVVAYLQTYLRLIDYPAASTVLLVTVAMVVVVDTISSRLRERIV